MDKALDVLVDSHMDLVIEIAEQEGYHDNRDAQQNEPRFTQYL